MSKTVHQTKAPPESSAPRILHAAAELFAKHGYNGVSASQIAKASSVSKASVFHHFGNKDNLYLEVIKYACQKSDDVVAHLDMSGQNSTEMLRTISRQHLQQLLENPDLYRLLIRETTRSGDFSATEMAFEPFIKNITIFIAFIEAAIKQGDFPENTHAGALATLIGGANLAFFLLQDIFRKVPAIDFVDEPEVFSDAVIDLLTRQKNSNQ